MKEAGRRQSGVTQFVKQGRRLRRFILLLPVALLLAASPHASGAAGAVHTSVGFSVSTFLDVEKERAQAITSIWSNLVAEKWGGTASTTVCKSLDDLEKKLRSKHLDLVVLLPEEYLQIRNKVNLEPLFVSARDKDIFDRLILVVRRDSNARRISDLKGKTLVQQHTLCAEGRNLWLDTILMRTGVRKPERFFAQSRNVLKPSAAILPVFFRREDACVVTLRSLQVMADLNPQLKRELLVLEESRPRPSAIIATRKGLSASHREMMRDVLQSLDRTVQGKQLLTLFRMNRLVPFRSEYLARLEELFREHDILRTRLAKRN